MFLRLLAPVAVVITVLAGAAVAPASTSHEGWPPIDGKLKMNKDDNAVPLVGGPRNDELLGGHGNDTITGNGGRDVIWGDYKPSGQPDTQVDNLDGGAGRDIIFASHGTNTINGGPGDDWIKAHWGRGTIDCGTGRDSLYISHRAQKQYTIRNCERISNKSLGF